MTDVALVLKSTNEVALVYEGATAASVATMIARWTEQVATQPDGKSKQSAQAQIDYYALHEAIEVPSGSVYVGDTWTGGTAFTAGPNNLAAAAETAEHAALSQQAILDQLRDLANGTQALSTDVQRNAAIRLNARVNLFLVRRELRRGPVSSG